MSTFNPEDFQSPQNITVPIESRVIDLNRDTVNPTDQFKINTGNQFAKIIAKFKIVNQSGTSTMTFRIPSPSAPLREIPPNTSTTVEEYTYYLEINFEDTNITSYVELDLVDPRDGKIRSSPVGQGAA